MALEVRPVTAPDEPAWRELFSAYGRFYETEFPVQVLDGVWAWLMDPNHPERCFVAVDNGEILGFAHLQQQVDTFRAGTGWFLDDLYVRPEARGRGVGRALIEALSAFAKEHGGGDVRWITAEDNHTAQSLYDSLAKKTTWVLYEKDTGTTP